MPSIDNLLIFNLFIKTLILGSAFAAGFLLARHLYPDDQEAKARQRLGVGESSKASSDRGIFRWFRPVNAAFGRYLASADPKSFLGRYVAQSHDPVHRKLISANLRDEITPEEFLGFRFVTAILVPFLASFFFDTMGRSLPGFGVLAFVVAGFYFPDLVLRQRIQVRRRAIVRDMPYALDLLTLSVEAGLDFMAAISRLTQRARPGPLLTEFGHLLREIRLGTSRADALRNLNERLAIPEMSSFTTLLIQADQLGVSIGQVLRAQSDQLRASRFQSAEIAGAKASVAALFPLAFFILPSILLLMFGPIAIRFFLTGGLG